ncbi:MAG: J domain-containing protein [Armatimonadetes bacterium]|nr:J domain-containing protein [Armatimonadota bacterium]
MTPAEHRTHYETLGLPETATPEEVRRRFRELARRHHPDIDKSPGASSRFKDINEAHRVLSDAGRRTAYDYELRSRRAARRPEPKPAAAPPSQGYSSAAKQTTSSSRSGAPSSGPGFAAQALLDRARTHFGKMQFREAEYECRKAIGLAVGYAPAYELMGDIHRACGRRNEALGMYTYGIQMDPRSATLRAKFDSLMSVDASTTSRTFRRRRSRPVAVLVSLPFLLGLIYALVAAAEPVAQELFFIEWPSMTGVVLVAAGLVLGAALALSGYLSSAREELLFTASGRSGTSTVPLGIILVGFAMMWFYASFILYLVIAARQDRVSLSVVVAFGASFALTAIVALACSGSLTPLLTFGGNFVFLGFVLGWSAATAVR